MPGSIKPTLIVSSATATKMSAKTDTSTRCSFETVLTARRWAIPSRISTNSMAPVSFRCSVRAKAGSPCRLRSSITRQA